MIVSALEGGGKEVKIGFKETLKRGRVKAEMKK
jgi:hypothetical protein